MEKRFSAGKALAFVSCVLVFSLMFAPVAFAEEDSPLAGGLVIVEDTPPVIEITPPQETPGAANEIYEIAEEETLPAEGEAAEEEDDDEDESPEDGELAEDVGDVFADVEAEAEPAPPRAKPSPKTGDNAMLFVILAALSLAVLAMGAYFAKKSKKNK
ncbi:MAG: LPXTG cell wall anchor domain-containing protein [Oscillospiraceae bacterium]|nr:LPXTG cell wall anchor domain-containing protein [Oscillospiraceae bacterium]